MEKEGGISRGGLIRTFFTDSVPRPLAAASDGHRPDSRGLKETSFSKRQAKISLCSKI